MAISETKARQIMADAVKAANEAGEAQLQKLVGAGPQWNVMQGKRVVGQMLDVCGGAYVRIDGRNPLVNALKKIGTKRDKWSDNIDGENWYMFKGVYKGKVLNVRTNVNRQEMSVNEAQAAAVVRVLEENGVSGAHVHSYID